MTGPLDSTGPHESPRRSRLVASDWRAGPRLALFWVALGLCLLSLVALAVVLFGFRVSWRDGNIALLIGLPAALIFLVTSLLLRAGLRTGYVLAFTLLCLIGLAPRSACG